MSLSSQQSRAIVPNNLQEQITEQLNKKAGLVKGSINLSLAGNAETWTIAIKYVTDVEGKVEAHDKYLARVFSNPGSKSKYSYTTLAFPGSKVEYSGEDLAKAIEAL